MQKTLIELPEIKLVGIKMRTNNKIEMNPETNKIGKIIQKYHSNNFSSKIKNRTKPGTTYCIYTEYESDYNSDYTYFVGEEVSSFEEVDSEFSTLVIPAQKYAKFANGPGKMPEICIDCWKKIWSMTEEKLGGTRTYRTDFEIYDERLNNPEGAVMDICISIK